MKKGKKKYLCDPYKNSNCDMEDCYMIGGSCMYTDERQYGKTIFDKTRDFVRNMFRKRGKR